MVGTLPAGQPTSRGTAEPSVARRRVGPDFGTSSLKLEDRSGQGWLWSPRTGDVAEPRALSAETYRRLEQENQVLRESQGLLARPTWQMLRKVMANKAPLVKVQAEKRSSETGGGQLPKELPFQLKAHLPLVAWEGFREAMNQALKREKLTRQRLRSTRGIPTLLGITSLVSSCVAMVLLHVLQIDAALGVGLLAVPPALALFGWTVMWILLMKHWRKHQRLLQDIMGCLRTCCEELSREHRALAVNLVTRTEETAAMDWLGRATCKSKDVFCVDFRIINEDFGNELRSLPKQRALDAEESTRPPSGKSEGSSLPAEQRGGAELRTLATLAPDEQLQLRPVSAGGTFECPRPRVLAPTGPRHQATPEQAGRPGRRQVLNDRLLAWLRHRLP
ncbi:unnamed protein product [Durusdinium trenchii]|uniref:Uncharacterized protein n=1 Tax=Durusdinium trenchii TaxID=1381693 RepID=A0ABP0L823_9DINO